MPFGTEPWFYQFTNGSVTITEAMGFKAVSVVCTTETTGTINSSRKVKIGETMVATPLTLNQDKPVTVSVFDPKDVLTGVTITAPSGCTLQVMSIE